MDFSPEALKARWDELTPQAQDLDTQREALWVELSGIVSGDTDLSVKDAMAREADIRSQVTALNAQIAPIDAERANIARALKGQTG